MHETFWTLLHDTAHWEFEIFLMTIFDGVIGYLGFRIFWPFLRKHWLHHLERDEREKRLVSPNGVLESYGINPEHVIRDARGGAPNAEKIFHEMYCPLLQIAGVANKRQSQPEEGEL